MVRRRPLLVAFGFGLVALFIVLELLLLRSYQDTERTTRDFQDTTDTTTALANVQREALRLREASSAVPARGDREAALTKEQIYRGLLARQLQVADGAATGRATLTRHIAVIRATLERFDRAAAGRRDRKGVKRALHTLDLQVKVIFDDEEHALYAALSQTLHERAKGQQLVVGLSVFALLFGIVLAAVTRRAVRGDFARAYAALAAEAHEREQLQEQLRHQATHDPLTDLGNRVQFARDLVEATALDRSELFAVLYVDLDGFKSVNDTLGHEAGDALLCEVALRLKASVRPSDRVARLGGDEFAVLIDGVADAGRALEAAERLRESVSAPWRLGGRTIRVGACIGVAVSDGSVDDADELIASADLAMYAAKHADKDGVRLFDTAMRAGARQRVELETDLRSAIERDELELHYQPIVDLSSEALLGLEALIRWQHPTRGMLAPIEFLPIAEECGLIMPIGRWVLERACRDAAQWPRPGGRDALWVSVNIAPAQMEDPGLIDDVTRTLGESGLDPSRLMLEISERTALTGGRHPGAVLSELRELGVRIALDDFGTGCTALSALRFLAVHVLKLDKSYIDEIATNPDRRRIVAAILELADTVGLETVAEGIEEPDQAAALKDLRCSMGQGFHYSKAIPPEAIGEFLYEATRPTPFPARHVRLA